MPSGGEDDALFVLGGKDDGSDGLREKIIMKDNFKRSLCIILCLCMTMGALAAFSSCNSTGEQQPTETTDPTASKVSVVRALKKLEAGSKIERASFEEVMVDPDTVPEGAYSTISEVVNKFVTTTVYAGDYLFEGKISKTANFLGEGENTTVHDDYVTITKYTDGISGDVSDAIQKAIDENPNKTIYFPDGTYNVSKPIKTSADPAKCVSLRFSNYAIVTTYGDGWELTDSIFELGAKDDVNSMDAVVCFMGGIFNANTKCGAITVAGGNVLINNISIKQTQTGITIKDGARADVDSCVVIGNSKDDAIGVLMEGEESTLTNMRLCNITIGIKLTGANNVLRNIHPLFVNSDDEWSAGFYDLSSGNFYDVCYSDQFAISFRMGEDTKSIYNACFGYWYKGVDGNQYGFYADGLFNSIVRDTRITMKAEYRENVDFGYVVEGDTTGATGNGVVLYPRGIGTYKEGDTEVRVDEHSATLKKYLKTVIFN